MKPMLILAAVGVIALSGCSYCLEAALKDENRKKLDRGEIDYYEYVKMNETLDEVGGMERR